MQGQIIRVNGKFKSNNLPKLSDFDTSYLLQEILNHPSCLSFYDFTDQSTMTLEGNKVLNLEDKKGRSDFAATSLELAPIYNPDLFNGRGGVIFNGAQEGSIANFYPTNQTFSIDTLAQISILPTDTATFYTIISSASAGSVALYYRKGGLNGYNGNFNILWDGKAFNKNRFTTVHDYRGGVSPNIELYLNSVQGVYQNAVAPAKPAGRLNVGRWNDASVPNYGLFALGSIILFNGNIHKEDEYLNALLKEFYLRQYNI